MIELLRSALTRPHFAIFATLFACFLLFSPASTYNEDLGIKLPPFINDKVVHALMFAGLTFLWLHLAIDIKWVFIFGLSFAIFSEIVQSFLPKTFQRSFDLKDILADLIGIGLGALMFWLYSKIFG